MELSLIQREVTTCQTTPYIFFCVTYNCEGLKYFKKIIAKESKALADFVTNKNAKLLELLSRRKVITTGSNRAIDKGCDKVQY